MAGHLLAQGKLQSAFIPVTAPIRMVTQAPEITPEAISDYLETRDDFDLELFAYRSLTSKGWLASHGGTYIDPVTSKIRQYDVAASCWLDGNHLVQLAVECKSLSTEAPLVVSRVPRPESESHHSVLRRWWRAARNDLATSIETSPIDTLRLYSPSEMVGKSTFQVRWDKSGGGRLIAFDSEIHEKWSQALSSVAELIKNLPKPSPHGGGMLAFVMPILVLSDSTLWVVDYGQDGRRSPPQKVDEATLFVDRAYPIAMTYGTTAQYQINHLHVCTRKGFIELIRLLSSPTALIRERIFGFADRKQQPG